MDALGKINTRNASTLNTAHGILFLNAKDIDYNYSQFSFKNSQMYDLAFLSLVWKMLNVLAIFFIVSVTVKLTQDFDYVLMYIYKMVCFRIYHFHLKMNGYFKFIS